MPENPTDRRGELMAAELAGDLSPAERAEMDRLRRNDPTIDAELDELRSLTGALARFGGGWTEQEPPSELRERVTSLPEASGLTAAPADSAPAGDLVRDRFRRRASVVLGAAACMALGAGVAAGVYGLAAAPPSGPPGTLGAVEEVDFTTAPSGVRAEGALVAHTWGTETVLEIDGLNPGVEYSLVLMAADGSEFASGALLGSEVTIECRMNAAVLREDVTRVEIRQRTGAVVMAADVPAAVGA